MTHTPINIAVTDDHALFREGITKLLAERKEVHLLFEARNGADLQQKIKTHGAPEVVLMDINMPVMDGCEATKWIKKEYPQLRVLALSMHDDEMNIIKMIRNGADGYLLKDSTTNEVVRAIVSVINTGVYLNELLSGRLFNSIRQEGINPLRSLTITPREKEFMTVCCSELTYKEIAARMNITIKTVNNYREALFEKLELKSRVGIVLFALKKGIVNLQDL